VGKFLFLLWVVACWRKCLMNRRPLENSVHDNKLTTKPPKL